DELRLGAAARRPALGVEVARVQEVVHADHPAAEHVAGVLEDDAETVQLDLLAVRERVAGPAPPDLQDRDGLRGHDPTRGQMVHVSVAHDAARRLPRRVQDDLLQRLLDEDAAFVAHARHDRLVKMYRVGTRRYEGGILVQEDRKSTRLNSSHVAISY